MVHWEGSPTGFGEIIIDNTREGAILMMLAALHYPYVLAFEPTSVEIRHVETGLISQVIQGNNLRLLFADTSPLTTNTASQVNPHPVGYERAPGRGRDEILLVSDDRVLLLRTTMGQSQASISDSTSMASVPR